MNVFPANVFLFAFLSSLSNSRPFIPLISPLKIKYEYWERILMPTKQIYLLLAKK